MRLLNYFSIIVTSFVITLAQIHRDISFTEFDQQNFPHVQIVQILLLLLLQYFISGKMKYGSDPALTWCHRINWICCVIEILLHSFPETKSFCLVFCFQWTTSLNIIFSSVIWTLRTSSTAHKSVAIIALLCTVGQILGSLTSNLILQFDQGSTKSAYLLLILLSSLSMEMFLFLVPTRASHSETSSILSEPFSLKLKLLLLSLYSVLNGICATLCLSLRYRLSNQLREVKGDGAVLLIGSTLTNSSLVTSILVACIQAIMLLFLNRAISFPYWASLCVTPLVRLIGAIVLVCLGNKSGTLPDIEQQLQAISYIDIFGKISHMLFARSSREYIFSQVDPSIVLHYKTLVDSIGNRVGCGIASAWIWVDDYMSSSVDPFRTSVMLLTAALVWFLVIACFSIKASQKEKLS